MLSNCFHRLVRFTAFARPTWFNFRLNFYYFLIKLFFWFSQIKAVFFAKSDYSDFAAGDIVPYHCLSWRCESGVFYLMSLYYYYCYCWIQLLMVFCFIFGRKNLDLPRFLFASLWHFSCRHNAVQCGIVSKLELPCPCLPFLSSILTLAHSLRSKLWCNIPCHLIEDYHNMCKLEEFQSLPKSFVVFKTFLNNYSIIWYSDKYKLKVQI